jgi:exopolyphosphatase
MPHRQDPATIAALDLGSNSFHMVVAQPQDGRFRVIDRMREVVRLGAGFDGQNRLTPEASERALRCLSRFGQRIRHLPPDAVRAVGTNALRMARNSESFLSGAELALGHAIDVVSGYEEARLIYLGVSHGLGDSADLRLVIDIGGGSTEVIVGRRFEPLVMESLHMGCVSMSQSFFRDGVIDAARMRAAEIAARQEIEPVEEAIGRSGWQVAIGASGTLLAINRVLAAQGWATDGITREAMLRLRAALIDAGHVERLTALGISADRAPVLPGGLAIALGAFEELGITPERCAARRKRKLIPGSRYYPRTANIADDVLDTYPGPYVTIFRPKGCDKCAQTGFMGRRGIYELLMMDDMVGPLVLKGADAQTIKRAAMEQGMDGLRDDGARKVLGGMTSVEEVLLATQDDMEVEQDRSSVRNVRV